MAVPSLHRCRVQLWQDLLGINLESVPVAASHGHYEFMNLAGDRVEPRGSTPTRSPVSRGAGGRRGLTACKLFGAAVLHPARAQDENRVSPRAPATTSI